MWLPDTERRLRDKARQVIDDCRADQDQRMAQARQLRQWKLMGSNDGAAAIYNKLLPHIDRLKSYLFSPAELRFKLDFESIYPQITLAQGEMASRVVTRAWNWRDIDLTFGKAVDQALTYGGCPVKFMWTDKGLDARLIMPWCFGVYRSDRNGLAAQEAVCESTKITPYELWRRISHLPEARDMYRRAVNYTKQNTSGDFADAEMANVLFSGSPPGVQTTMPYTNQPGGFVDIAANYADGMLQPVVSAGLIGFHELWVWDDARADYTTIQFVEPDILICPLYKRANLFVEGSQMVPYTLVQPNIEEGYFWGRPELLPLLKLQSMLRDGMIDIKKIMALQYDRVLAFNGFGMNDERYDQLRRAGWIANEDGKGSVEDLTPELPKEAFKYIDDIVRMMDESSGFVNIMTGQGEPGVRAGNHAQALMRFASPHLRDRALIVERQAADGGSRSFALIRAKDDRTYWTAASDDKGDEKSKATEFLLSQLPEDWRMSVDSHSSSPIYQQDNLQSAVLLAKFGAVDGEALIEASPMQQKDTLIQRYKDRQERMAELAVKAPWLFMQKNQPQNGQRPSGG